MARAIAPFKIEREDNDTHYIDQQEDKSNDLLPHSQPNG
jgi:hypothetical protein